MSTLAPSSSSSTIFRANRQPLSIVVLKDSEYNDFRQSRVRRVNITPLTATTPSVAVWGRDHPRSRLGTPSESSNFPTNSPSAVIFDRYTITEESWMSDQVYEVYEKLSKIDKSTTEVGEASDEASSTEASTSTETKPLEKKAAESPNVSTQTSSSISPKNPILSIAKAQKHRPSPISIHCLLNHDDPPQHQLDISNLPATDSLQSLPSITIKLHPAMFEGYQEGEDGTLLFKTNISLKDCKLDFVLATNDEMKVAIVSDEISKPIPAQSPIAVPKSPQVVYSHISIRDILRSDPPEPSPLSPIMTTMSPPDHQKNYLSLYSGLETPRVETHSGNSTLGFVDTPEVVPIGFAATPILAATTTVDTRTPSTSPTDAPIIKTVVSVNSSVIDTSAPIETPGARSPDVSDDEAFSTRKLDEVDESIQKLKLHSESPAVSEISDGVDSDADPDISDYEPDDEEEDNYSDRRGRKRRTSNSPVDYPSSPPRKIKMEETESGKKAKKLVTLKPARQQEYLTLDPRYEGQIKKLTKPYIPIIPRLKADPNLWSAAKKRKKGFYTCHHCEGKYKNMAEFSQHLDEYAIRRLFICEEEDCPWSVIGFSKRGEWLRHMKSFHSENSFPCPICQRGFIRKDSMKRHLLLVHHIADFENFQKFHDSKNKKKMGHPVLQR